MSRKAQHSVQPTTSTAVAAGVPGRNLGYPTPMIIQPRQLKARAIPQAPDPPFESTFSDFVQQHLAPLWPAEAVIRHHHQLLMDYIREPKALFIVRSVSGQKRGEAVTTLDGTKLLPSDNAPAWFWHSVMFNGLRFDRARFREFVQESPTHLFEVSRFQTVNTAGWHVAHILDAKDGNTSWETWNRQEAVRRFVRNIHPLNLFYVPKADWQRVGGDPELIGYVAWVYSELWPDMWAELTEVAGTQTLRPDAESRVLRIDAPSETSRSVALRGRGPSNRASWDFVLGARRSKPITAILSQHPAVEARTARLQEGLTLERFVALGDALYNKTRKSMLQKRAPENPRRQAEIAFDLLDAWITKTYSKPSGWTGAIKLLRDGADEGLDQVRDLDIHGLATSALRVVDGPYREANELGLT